MEGEGNNDPFFRGASIFGPLFVASSISVLALGGREEVVGGECLDRRLSGRGRGPAVGARGGAGALQKDKKRQLKVHLGVVFACRMFFSL